MRSPLGIAPSVRMIDPSVLPRHAGPGLRRGRLRPVSTTFLCCNKYQVVDTNLRNPSSGGSLVRPGGRLADREVGRSYQRPQRMTVGMIPGALMIDPPLPPPRHDGVGVAEESIISTVDIIGGKASKFLTRISSRCTQAE